jgi:hypothetical protein
VVVSTVPIPDPAAAQANICLSGNVLSALNPLSGCRFHPLLNNLSDNCKSSY